MTLSLKALMVIMIACQESQAQAEAKWQQQAGNVVGLVVKDTNSGQLRFFGNSDKINQLITSKQELLQQLRPDESDNGNNINFHQLNAANDIARWPIIINLDNLNNNQRPSPKRRRGSKRPPPKKRRPTKTPHRAVRVVTGSLYDPQIKIF